MSGNYANLLWFLQPLDIAPYRGTYDLPFVALSVGVAVLSMYVALSVADRIGASPRKFVRLTWIAVGAVVMGSGIWAMHFIGMLAFSLPCKIGYDPLLTLLSILPGVLASGVALFVLSRKEQPSQNMLFACALLMGAGIGAMHYSGMVAMEPGALLRYDIRIVALSVVVAVALAYLALVIRAKLNHFRGHRVIRRLLPAAIMGFAAMLRNRLKQGSADVAKDLPRIQPFPAPRPSPLWTYGGYAAAVVLAGLSAYLVVMQTLSRNAQDALRTELAQERERSAGLKEQLRTLQTPSGKTLDLQPGIARSGGMVPEITLPPAPQRIRIELVLPYPSSALFHVRLRRNGSQVWSETGLKATPSSSASTLVFEAPVESGKYDLIVTPEANPNGQITYPFDAKIAQ